MHVPFSRSFRFPSLPIAPSQIRQIEDLKGPVGRLEAVLNTGAHDAPIAALICHPYPPAGGTLHNKVVYHAMKALTALGLPVLRFNFRGVGRSEGHFDHGRGEEEDVRSAVDYLDRSLGLPILLVGFSFGSYVGLRATCSDQRLIGRIGLGLPVRAAGRNYTYEFLPECGGPLLFVSGDHDQFSPAEVLDKILTTASAAQRTVIVAGADHFFQGVPGSPASKLDRMQTAISAWVLDEHAARDRVDAIQA